MNQYQNFLKGNFQLNKTIFTVLRSDSITTFAISGSEEIKLQNLVIAAGPSSIPSSMLISRTWAPISTCNLATLRAS